MKIIEFFISGSGKPQLKIALLKRLKIIKNCYDYREILTKFLPLEEKIFLKN